MNTFAAAPKRTLSKPWSCLLFAALVAAIIFVFVAAMPYFLGDAEKLSRYSNRKPWLLAHIGFGIVALLVGPFQLWLGFTQPRGLLHRRLGMVYLGAIAVSCVAAYYLAATTTVSFTFGFGLAGLATAWVVTNTLAMVAVKRRQYLQHQEWMVRSYVVTFGFVTFRIMFLLLNTLNVATVVERLNVASWFCWAVPLLICEGVIQGRKLRAATSPADAEDET